MSPKNKGKFGKGKPAIETEDQFVSGASRVADALRPHVWRIALAVSVVTIVVVAFSLYQWWNHKQETEATTIYAEAMKIAQSPVTPEDEDDPAADEETTVVEPESYPTNEARAEAALAVLERLQSDYGGTDVANQARLLEASLLYDLERYDEALTAYDDYVDHAVTARLRAVAREGIGYVYEAKAMALDDPDAREQALEQALEAFRHVQPGDEGPMRDVALYHQGRILQRLGRTEQAVEVLQQALDVDPESVLAGDIEYRLAQLDAPVTE